MAQMDRPAYELVRLIEAELDDGDQVADTPERPNMIAIWGIRMLLEPYGGKPHPVSADVQQRGAGRSERPVSCKKCRYLAEGKWDGAAGISHEPGCPEDHNHLSRGIYPNCPACGTVLPPKEG